MVLTNHKSISNTMETKLLNKYMFFTGAYEYNNHFFRYEVIENGKKTVFDHSKSGFSTGFYVLNNNEPKHIDSDEPLLFRGMKNGPKDGIYSNSEISNNNYNII